MSPQEEKEFDLRFAKGLTDTSGVFTPSQETIELKAFITNLLKSHDAEIMKKEGYKIFKEI